MREVKFRFWDRENEKYWYANTLQSVSILSKELGMPLNQLVVHQYIGRNDKNGSPVYEGDFLKFRGPTKLCEDTYMHSIYEIDFYEGSFLRPYIYHSFNGVNYTKLGPVPLVNPIGRAKIEDNKMFDWNDAEIIGNVFNNKLMIEK
jgi:uncharacterized phage protein (TIGR01671 family)